LRQLNASLTVVAECVAGIQTVMVHGNQYLVKELLMKNTLMQLTGIKSIKKQEKLKDPLPLALDMNSRFVYASGSNVMSTWKKYGFVPPTEYRDDYMFGKNREEANKQ
jgi:hypothetical protein